jgi:predicted nucleic acid-binding Zn ribbon protein
MKTCKQCSGEVTKLISNCSFQLKGTGWYVTDYGKKVTGSGGGATKEEKKSEEKKTAQEPSAEKKDS